MLRAIIIFTLCFGCGYVQGAQTTASWYSMKDCLAEGDTGIMANGRRLDDAAYTCAAWKYPFGTPLRVTNLRNGKSIVVRVTDRGPSKRLYRQGRVVDLSKAAFARIASLKAGVIPVKVERIVE